MQEPEYVDDPFEQPMPEIQRFLANCKRKLTPNQVVKLMSRVPKYNPKYQSPEYLLNHDPEFELYLLEKIAWANGSQGSGRKPTGSLISAICNYEAPYHGWVEWKQRRVDGSTKASNETNGASPEYGEQVRRFLED